MDVVCTSVYNRYVNIYYVYKKKSTKIKEIIYFFIIKKKDLFNFFL